jgi:hypothetical protein
MSNGGFALLWSKTLYSSLWVKESKETRILFLTMLMLKNSDGVVQASVVGLADAAKITPDECRQSLKDLLSPDPDDSSKVDEGRRLCEIPGGWQIVNSDAYRFSSEAKRAFWAQQKAEQRAREAEKLKAQGKFVDGYESEKKKRRKRTPKVEGQMAGAKSAISEGFAESNGHTKELSEAARSELDRYNREKGLP